MAARLSLSELSSAGLRLTSAEAAAIVTEICNQITRGTLRGVPSCHVIRIGEDGTITAEGPVGADRATVSRAAKLLESMLAPPDAPAEFRAPGSLRLILARAQGKLDVPPFAGLDEFCAATARFAIPDLTPRARDLYAAWKAATQQPPLPAASGNVLPAPVGPTELTISDVRRARRATGLTIADVAERSRVPAPLLLELEWGYLRNWPAGFYGRAQLVRYARAAGLDERLVLAAAWPLLEEAIETRGGDAIVPLPATRALGDEGEERDAPVVESVDAPVLRAVPFPRAAPRRRRRWIVALAIPAAIALALVPAFIEHEHHAAQGTTVALTSPASAPAATAQTAQPIQSVPSLPPAQPVRRRHQDVQPATRVVKENAAYSPSFSNVGTAMFFHEEAGDHSALMRADTDGRGTVLKITRIVDDNAQNFHARPSPDGKLIAFDSDRDGTRGVYIATADGTEVRRVSGPGFAAVPSWSPDGRQLAFVRAEESHPNVWNLWTTDLETGTQRRLTSYAVGQPWGGSWFPDGQHIAYSHETELVILDLTTGRGRTFETPVKGRLVRTPAVSPDGRRIIFQVFHDGAWLLDVDRGTMRRVLDDPSAEEYTWSPDGRRVAFHSHRSGGWGVWIMGQ